MNILKTRKALGTFLARKCFRFFSYHDISRLKFYLNSSLIKLSFVFFPFFADIFKHDPEYLENEEKYKAIRAEILGEESSGSDGSGSDDDESGEDSDDDQEEGGKIRSRLIRD